MAYIAPHSPVADWRCVPEGVGYGNYFDPVSGTWATVTRTTPKTARIAADKLVDVPAGYLALEPWSLHKSGGVGLAAIIEEARTNAYLDSYFAAADISAAWATDGTLTRSTDVPAVYGTHVAKAVYTGTVGDSNATKVLLSQERPYSAAQTVTTSAWARGSATGLTVQRFIEAVDVSNAVLGTVTANITLGAWARGTLTYANLPAGTVKTRSGIRATGVDENDTVTLYASAVQSEVGSFATSYIPTTTAAVTRNADVVTVPTTGWNASKGTFVAVAQAPTIAQARIMSWHKDGDEYYDLYYVNNYIVGMTRNQTNSIYDAAVCAASTYATFAMTYNVGSITRVYKDGTMGTRADTMLAAVSGLPSVAHIGTGFNGTGAFANSPIARVTIYDTALSDAQLQAADMTTDLLAGLDTTRITNEVTL